MIRTLVITGGPCAGKSTTIEHLKDTLGKRYNLVVIPEMATMLLSHGFPLNDKTLSYHFQNAVITSQMMMEDSHRLTAEGEMRNTIIICDRGLLDNNAYSPGIVEKVSGEETKTLLDRYDGVIHLITAADGVPEAYETESNVHRYETAEEAVSLDERIRNAWVGHDSLKVIAAEKDFQHKLNLAVEAVESFF